MSVAASILKSRFFRVMAASILLAVALSSASGQAPDFSFVPDGGKDILLASFGPDSAGPPALEDIVAMTKTQDEWLRFIKDKLPELDEKQQETMAAYMGNVLPLTEAGLAQAVAKGDVADALPADGKALAIENCQSCHSFFSGYLMQKRDLQGWRNIFLSPFHSEIKMTEAERDIFARYSAINMPLKYEDVPPEWRF